MYYYYGVYMFSRIREAIRIITHREPNNGPDAVIVDRGKITPPRAGLVIAQGIEVLAIAYIFGFFAGKIGPFIYKFVQVARIKFNILSLNWQISVR